MLGYETTVIPNQTVRLVRRISRDFCIVAVTRRRPLLVSLVSKSAKTMAFSVDASRRNCLQYVCRLRARLAACLRASTAQKIEPSDATFAEAQWLAQLLEGVESVSDRTIGGMRLYESLLEVVSLKRRH